LVSYSNIFIFFLVDDDIVIKIIGKKIQEFENEKKNWIIEGFPRTKIQALSLSKLGIIPDKLINI
jgi:adenylate kinase